MTQLKTVMCGLAFRVTAARDGGMVLHSRCEPSAGYVSWEDAREESGVTKGTGVPDVSSLSDDFPDFADTGVLASLVPVTLDIFLLAIDECRYLIEQHGTEPRSEAKPSSALHYAKPLSHRERGEVEQIASSFWRDLSAQIDLELAENFGDDPEEEDEKEQYPFAKEALALIAYTRLKQVEERVVRQHLEPLVAHTAKMDYARSLIRLGPSGRIASMLGQALLPRVIAEMEAFLSGLIRSALTGHPDALGDLPDVPSEIIRRYQGNLSSADIMRWQIDKKIASLVESDPDEWQRRLLRWSRIDITHAGSDWGILNEAIQRRHIVIHNGGRADARYLSRVSLDMRKGVFLGKYLDCGPAYLLPVLIELETWGLALAFRWSKNFFRANVSDYPGLFTRILYLESKGRWTQALTVLDSVLVEPIPADGDYSDLARLNRWFCLQQLGRENAALLLEVEEWSPQDRDYKIGRFALLRDENGMISLLEECARQMRGQQLFMWKRHLADMPLIARAMGEFPNVARFIAGRSSAKSVGGSQANARGSKARKRPRH